VSLVIAHRGASADAPENTFAAFELALEQGANMIETDLHLLGDGQIVLCHDDEVGGKSVGDLTLEELREILPDVPTLAETFEEFAQRIPFNLEIKRSRDREYVGIERCALDIVRQHGVLEQTVFSSFEDSVLQRVRELEPLAPLALLIPARGTKGAAKRAAALGAETINLRTPQATPALIKELHASGFRVQVYTVDDPRRQTRLIEAGIDGIFTNAPGRLRRLLDSRAQ
jgi:glycerophosphoryl diester phosphodiesterase